MGRRPYLLSTACSVLMSAGAFAVTPVFINEIHYDNASSDVGEAIEIAGPAGTDLGGWSIVLYNGSSTSLAPYNTRVLSGTLADLGGGFVRAHAGWCEYLSITTERHCNLYPSR